MVGLAYTAIGLIFLSLALGIFATRWQTAVASLLVLVLALVLVGIVLLTGERHA